MKTALATMIILGTLASSIVAGALFFSPNADLAGPTAPGVPGSVTVVVTDDEGDPVEKAKVSVKDDANNRTGKTETTDATGKALVHLPTDGWYSIHTELPSDYSPRTDIDKEQPGLCQGEDHRLCITVQLKGAEVTLEGDKTPRTELTVEANDLTPEPRVSLSTFDSSTDKDLAGGRVIITRLSDNKVIYTEDHKAAKEVIQVASDSYSVAWIPPTTHHHHNDTHTLTLVVDKLVPVRMGAHPKKTAAVPTPTTGIQLPTRSIANVTVTDVDTGAGFDGGTLHVTFDGPRGGSLRLTYPTKGGAATVSLATGFDLDYVAPSGYQVVGAGSATVANGKQQAVQFSVKKKAQGKVAEEPIGEPEEDREQEANETRVDNGFIPIPVEEVETEEAPKEEPAETPEEAPASEDISTEPSTAELEADCFMYLEMYPELVELDAYLPTYCGQNPADALRIIGELLDDLDQ